MGATGNTVGPGHTNIRLILGMFAIFPASGVVLSGSSATVTVDMMSEIAMIGEEVCLIFYFMIWNQIKSNQNYSNVPKMVYSNMRY